jgi:hypothetical protein
MYRYWFVLTLALLGNAGLAFAEDDAAATITAQEVLASAVEQNKFTFIVFYKQDDAATRAIAKTIENGLAGREDQSELAYAQVTDSANKALIKQFGMERAPLPMALAIAPNGAITGVFNRKVTAELVADAFVTPTMAQCMKSMQESKVVLVCLHRAAKPAIPTGVRDLEQDPLFANRIAIIPLRLNEPGEEEFLAQMQVEPAKAEDLVVMMAPPGVLVGKFTTSTTKDEMAAALHKAGKCCDDPNCKHGKPSSAAKATPKKTVNR